MHLHYSFARVDFGLGAKSLRFGFCFPSSMRLFQRPSFFTGCIFIFVALTAIRIPAAPPPAISISPGREPEIVPIVVEDEWTQARSEIGSKVLSLLNAGGFAALDTMAGEFRRSQAEFANGYWRLSIFYRELGDLEPLPSEEDWAERIRLLRRWQTEDPKSITANVTLAIALVNYAWYERGAKIAKRIPPWQNSAIREPLLEASQILRSAYDLPERCPFWYSAWMVKAMLARDTREAYDAVFAEAVSKYPTYTPFYFLKAWRLLERWYGGPGEWEAFAKQSADEAGGEAGDILYARILWWIHDERFYNNPIEGTAMEWPRAQRGFEAIRRRYPASLQALSEYCSISGFAPSEPARLMRSLFEEVGPRVDLKVWRTTELFLRDRHWAYSH